MEDVKNVQLHKIIKNSLATYLSYKWSENKLFLKKRKTIKGRGDGNDIVRKKAPKKTRSVINLENDVFIYDAKTKTFTQLDLCECFKNDLETKGDIPFNPKSKKKDDGSRLQIPDYNSYHMVKKSESIDQIFNNQLAKKDQWGKINQICPSKFSLFIQNELNGKNFNVKSFKLNTKQASDTPSKGKVTSSAEVGYYTITTYDNALQCDPDPTIQKKCKRRYNSAARRFPKRFYNKSQLNKKLIQKSRNKDKSINTTEIGIQCYCVPVKYQEHNLKIEPLDKKIKEMLTQSNRKLPSIRPPTEKISLKRKYSSLSDLFSPAQNSKNNVIQINSSAEIRKILNDNLSTSSYSGDYRRTFMKPKPLLTYYQTSSTSKDSHNRDDSVLYDRQETVVATMFGRKKRDCAGECCRCSQKAELSRDLCSDLCEDECEEEGIESTGSPARRSTVSTARRSTVSTARRSTVSPVRRSTASPVRKSTIISRCDNTNCGEGTSYGERGGCGGDIVTRNNCPGGRRDSYEDRRGSYPPDRRSSCPADRRDTYEDRRSSCPADRRDTYEDRRSSCPGDRRSTFEDRRSSCGERASCSGDRRSTFEDRRSSCGDRRSSCGDRRSTFEDRRSSCSPRRSTIEEERSVCGDSLSLKSSMRRSVERTFGCQDAASLRECGVGCQNPCGGVRATVCPSDCECDCQEDEDKRRPGGVCVCPTPERTCCPCEAEKEAEEPPCICDVICNLKKRIAFQTELQNRHLEQILDELDKQDKELQEIRTFVLQCRKDEKKLKGKKKSKPKTVTCTCYTALVEYDFQSSMKQDKSADLNGENAAIEYIGDFKKSEPEIIELYGCKERHNSMRNKLNLFKKDSWKSPWKRNRETKTIFISNVVPNRRKHWEKVWTLSSTSSSEKERKKQANNGRKLWFKKFFGSKKDLVKCES